MQKMFSYLVVAILVLSFTCTSVLAKPVQVQDAESIHFNSTVVDGHNDTMMKVVDEGSWLPETDIGEETSFQLDIPKLREGGMDAPFLAPYTPGNYNNNPRSITRTQALIKALYWTEDKNRQDAKISPITKETNKTVKKK